MMELFTDVLVGIAVAIGSFVVGWMVRDAQVGHYRDAWGQYWTRRQDEVRARALGERIRDSPPPRSGSERCPICPHWQHVEPHHVIDDTGVCRCLGGECAAARNQIAAVQNNLNDDDRSD